MGAGLGGTLAHALTYALALAGMYVLLLALTAVYIGHQRALGVLGLVGYLTAAAGTVLVAGDWWFEAFAVPMIGSQAPEIVKLPAGGSVLVGAMVTSALFAAGWIAFGVAAFRSGAFFRPAAVAWWSAARAASSPSRPRSRSLWPSPSAGSATCSRGRPSAHSPFPRPRDRHRQQWVGCDLGSSHRDIPKEQSSRPVDEDLLGGFGLGVFVGSFDELAVDERRAGADERDQVRVR